MKVLMKFRESLNGLAFSSVHTIISCDSKCQILVQQPCINLINLQLEEKA